ncbi:hypothetical protein BCV70DRAFT_232681 [Testicularia cyperi]|uniref:Uncharacterized protein n=1 Tax=Testicularia cyperi TaxID=1882483 RepID=A0A317XLK6_9BASI|nr:hypothetical protein BCV70DRAFT_232681 [Testicularia cyperi]
MDSFLVSCAVFAFEVASIPAVPDDRGCSLPIVVFVAAAAAPCCVAVSAVVPPAESAEPSPVTDPCRSLFRSLVIPSPPRLGPSLPLVPSNCCALANSVSIVLFPVGAFRGRDCLSRGFQASVLCMCFVAASSLDSLQRHDDLRQKSKVPSPVTNSAGAFPATHCNQRIDAKLAIRGLRAAFPFQTAMRAETDTTPRASGSHQFTYSEPPQPNACKRSSALGGLSIAERTKLFQSKGSSSASASTSKQVTCTASTSTTKGTLPQKMIRDISPMAHSSQNHSKAQSTTTNSISLSPSPVRPASHVSGMVRVNSTSAPASAAPRIKVATPMHRRARSDVSIIDPFLPENGDGDVVRDTSVASSTSTSNLLHAGLSSNILSGDADSRRDTPQRISTRARPRSKTLAVTGSVAKSGSMQSISEETMSLRLSSSTETIRATTTLRSLSQRAPGPSPLVHSHDTFQVSPALSDASGADWHGFVSGNYGRKPASYCDNLISLIDHTFPNVKKQQQQHQQYAYMAPKLGKPDSPTLNDEATWLEEELARCSSDEEDDENTYDVAVGRDGEEFVTPNGSPTLQPVTFVPAVPQLLGLGIDSATDAPASTATAATSSKSADSLLEQVAMHEACLEKLHTLSRDEAEQASSVASAGLSKLELPSMPRRRSSLLVVPEAPALRKASSNGDFASTQTDSSGLFTDAHYDAASSPMADLGHGSLADSFASARRTSSSSYLSSGSTASGDASYSSHASSLLFNGLQIHAPSMERGGSSDTAYSTRPSSIASSNCLSSVRDSFKPPRSPMRMNATPLPPLPQEAGETPQLPACEKRASLDATVAVTQDKRSSHDVARRSQDSAHGSECSLSSKASARVLRQANRRKEGTEKPLPPARLGSLEAAVAAAPGHEQVREEFPDRLLGDWMATNESKTVQPIPMDRRLRSTDGQTTYIPGLGEIVPPSPDVAGNGSVGSAAWKRLGSPLSDDLAYGSRSKSAARNNTLKSKLSGKLGLSKDSSAVRAQSSSSSLRKTASMLSSNSTSDLDATPVPMSTSRSGNVLGRLRNKPSGRNDRRGIASGATAALAELPAAWQDRIGASEFDARPSLDARRPSFASSISSSSYARTFTPQPGPGTVAVHDEGRSRSSLGFLNKMFAAGNGSSSAVNSYSGDDRTVSVMLEGSRQSVTLDALVASTFQSPTKNAECDNTSPRNTRRRERRAAAAARRNDKEASFFDLSDDDSVVGKDSGMHATKTNSTVNQPEVEEDDSLPVHPHLARGAMRSRIQGRKDLSKLFGATQDDLSQAKVDLTGEATHTAPITATKETWSASLGRSTFKKRSALW